MKMKIRSKNILTVLTAMVMAFSGLYLFFNPGPIFPQSIEEELDEIGDLIG